jgi:hypothetical protein
MVAVRFFTRAWVPALAFLLGTAAVSRAGIRAPLDTDGLPSYLRDRGTGVPTSMFGTYIQKGQVLVYPFFEYYQDSDAEYAPNELGQTLDQDFRGEYNASEYLIFLSYGFTDRLAVEFEAAYIDAELETAREDTTGLADEITESGLGDVEGQVRYRFREETTGGPEVFSYFETVFPTADEGSLIGTTDWEFKLGFGAVRGYAFGTMTARAAVEYDKSEDKFGLGEAAIEYLRRLSASWRVLGGFEGNEDEVEAIVEAQWHFAKFACLKMNSAFGVTSKATDWAPEVGVMFNF